jgi:ABC-type Fe3+-hydroxamate transport system substrate-binding protein
VRVVSLVPSVTETLVALGVAPIACTRFCDLPGVPTVGGTKNPDVDAIVALAPDLVVVNDEENRREDADALHAAGVKLHAMSPRSVGDVRPELDALCAALGIAAPTVRLPERVPVRARAFIATWRRPWMTMNRDTYGSSVLEMIGLENVFGDAEARYPETTIADVVARAPDVVLLPDEPYPFTARHVPEVRAALPDADVRIVDGRDLFWWGIRTSAALARLRAVV